jgi:hypothetical protein
MLDRYLLRTSGFDRTRCKNQLYSLGFQAERIDTTHPNQGRTDRSCLIYRNRRAISRLATSRLRSDFGQATAADQFD